MPVARLIVSKLTYLLFFGRVKISSVKAAILILSSRTCELDLSVGYAVRKTNLVLYIRAQLGFEIFSIFVEFFDISSVECFHKHKKECVLSVFQALENIEFKLYD